MTVATRFQPGSLVSARGREWIVLPESDDQTLHLRPLGASEEDSSLIYLPLERQPVTSASFPLPDPTAAGTHVASRLLRDALLLKLRSGAGPFRSFGNIALEPRAYQLVPLLMALKLDVVRLLVADDVGIGKTIEGALIARELLDRGEISRLAVLCPPHLCDQWQGELLSKFHIRAEIVGASTAHRLERGLPPNTSLFEAWPYTVVSLDYIKSERRYEEFLRACPEFVIVDEAHTCTFHGQGSQQRHRLLKKLSEDGGRHIVMLTATPHSGDEAAFFNLLSLLDRDFSSLQAPAVDERHPLRQRLANHFVQRRRVDIAEWQDATLFPDRKTKEETYKLTGRWGRLFDEVLSYARELVKRTEGQSRARQRMGWWAALALLRCVSSSPAAAVMALRTRLDHPLDESGEPMTPEQIEMLGRSRVLDGSAETLTPDDVTPAGRLEDSSRLKALIELAEELAGEKNDPKLAALADHVEKLLKDGFRPVVFCRYIATADYVADHLAARFKDHNVIAVTGQQSSGEREAKVQELGGSEKYILVATDCLSEGINLQEYFTAVVHYDLSWNPTRHEQREGRVDRFGQKAREVRAIMLYGQDNPVDGAVLQVIVRKAESIRKELGVLVPVPEDEAKLTEALVNAVLLRKGTATGQGRLEFGEEVEAIESAWQSAREREARNRSLFAQRRMKPDEVLPEWRRTLDALGGEEDVERFVKRALVKLNAPLEEARDGFKVVTANLPVAVRERLAAEGLNGTIRIRFRMPVSNGYLFIHRTHPLASILADHLLERALAGDEADFVARAGAIFTKTVSRRTSVYLLRLRHQLTVTRYGRTRLLLCEETVTATVPAGGAIQAVTGTEAKKLLDAEAARNMPQAVKERHVTDALALAVQHRADLERIASERASVLLGDHRRVREASKAAGTFEVKPSLPVDVIGVFVLVPAQD